MNEFGFVKTCACSPRIKVGDVDFNKKEIISIINDKAYGDNHIFLFPELSLTGYTCGDLFHQSKLLDDSYNALLEIKEYCYDKIVIVGLPLMYKSILFNVAAVIGNGKILGFVPKSYLPNYKEYYERRWFHSGKDLDISNRVNGIVISPNILFDVDFCEEEGFMEYKRMTFGIEICEDMWVPNPPSVNHSLAGAQIIFNPSASTETVGKAEYRRSLVEMTSARNVCGYL